MSDEQFKPGDIVYPTFVVNDPREDANLSLGEIDLRHVLVEYEGILYAVPLSVGFVHDKGQNFIEVSARIESSHDGWHHRLSDAIRAAIPGERDYVQALERLCSHLERLADESEKRGN